MIAVSGLMLFFIPLMQRRRARSEEQKLTNSHENKRTNNSNGKQMISNGLTSNSKLSSNNNLSEA
jgi:hypothetical protein